MKGPAGGPSIEEEPPLPSFAQSSLDFSCTWTPPTTALHKVLLKGQV